MIRFLAKLGQRLFFYGMIAGLLGVPTAMFGLLVVLITKSWTVAHAGLWMMGGGFLAWILGIVIISYCGRRILSQDVFQRFVDQHRQSGEIITVERLPSPTALPPDEAE